MAATDHSGSGLPVLPFDVRCSMLDVGCSRGRRGARAGFTLMELLVVISIISIFVGVIGYGFLRGSGSATVGLQASQSIVVGLLTQARSQAVLTGRPCALLVNNDEDSSRYRRYLVVAEQTGPTEWKPIDVGIFLPDGCYLVGADALTSDETTGENWSDLNSDALLLSIPSLSVEQTASEEWQGVPFTARGTRGGSMTQATALVLASGTKEPPSASIPFKYSNPDNVRGVSITMTGQFRLLNRREDF